MKFQPFLMCFIDDDILICFRDVTFYALSVLFEHLDFLKSIMRMHFAYSLNSSLRMSKSA